MPLMFGKITAEIKCTSCGGKGLHEAIYTAEPIQHMRCPACMAIDVFLIEQPEDTGEKHKAVAVLQDHAALMERRGSREASPYSTKESFSEGVYVEHPTFGVGYVAAVLGPPPKISVIFSDKKRLLVCGLPLIGERRVADREAQRAPARVASTSTTEPHDTGGAAVAKCPKCDEFVNAVNLRHAPDGSVVGCMHCQ
jgi:phage FluMu protein Com